MVMKRITLVLGAAGLAAALAGAALAQQAMGGHMDGHMGGHDPFGNATITRAEAQAKAGEMFARMDLNGDGRLDAADRAAGMAKRFDAMDANHDGVLSKQEFINAHQNRMGAEHMGAEHKGGKMGRHMMGRMMMGRMMLGQMDTNGDHAITRDEFTAGVLKHFDAADANHDGKLTPEERRAAFRQGMKMHMRGMGGAGHAMHSGMDHDMGDMPPPPPAN
jgi:hypothetical protein